MTDYDSMSVHELMMHIAAAACTGAYNSFDTIEPILRRKVIEEASVGEVEVKVRESGDELTAPKGSPDRIVTMSEQFICQTWIPEGKYRLVKKEDGNDLY